MKRSRHRRTLLLAGLGIALLAIYFGASLVVSPILQRRLAMMVASHLNADLHLGHLQYRFPYGVTATGVALVTRNTQTPVEIFRAKRIDFVLAELPKREGPLVIKKLILTDPSVSLVRNADGLFEGHNLVRREPGSTPFDPNRMKLSDFFRLRSFAIHNGQVIFSDRLRPGSPPMIWGGIATDLSIAPQSPALYRYGIDANDALAHLSAGGAINVDSLDLTLDKLDLAVRIRKDAPSSQLPVPVQDLLKNYPIAGELKLSGNARVPLRDLVASQFDFKLDLPEFSAKLPKWGATIDDMVLALRITSKALPVEESDKGATEARETSPSIRIERFEAHSGDSAVTIEKGVLNIDRVAGTWRLRRLLGDVNIGRDHQSLPAKVREQLEALRASGTLRLTATASGPLKIPPGKSPAEVIDFQALITPRAVTLQPGGFPLPFEKVAGSISVQPAMASVQNLEGRYGSDRVMLTSARIPLKGLNESVKIQDITGTVDFSGQHQPYPDVLDKSINLIHPSGLCVLSGNCIVHPRQPKTTEYKIGLSSDRANLSIAIDGQGRRLTATEVQGDVLFEGIGPDGFVEITNVQGVALGGRVKGHGRITTHAPVAYMGDAHFTDIDLPALAKVWAPPGNPPPRWTGKGFADCSFDGSGANEGKTGLDLLAVKGEFEILEGDFFEIPGLRDILRTINLSKDAATVGEAAGIVSIHDRIAEFTHAAVSSPVLGLQGSGTVGFDGTLDLSLIAAPLADWKSGLKRTGVPIISDVTGEIAGGIQKLLNGATKTLLYQFRVTGTIADPQTRTVPAAGLREGAAKLFGAMIAPRKGGRLLDDVKNSSK